MHITLIFVGETADALFSPANEEYVKRIRAFADINIVAVKPEPLDDRHALSESAISKALSCEEERVLKLIPKGSGVVSLCIEGKLLSSEQFADFFTEKQSSGVSHFTFIIGSSHGISESLKAKSVLKLSMSKMTFPHKLAKTMLLEQLYRAFSINAGTKYHK